MRLREDDILFFACHLAEQRRCSVPCRDGPLAHSRDGQNDSLLTGFLDSPSSALHCMTLFDSQPIWFDSELFHNWKSEKKCKTSGQSKLSREQPPFV